MALSGPLTPLIDRQLLTPAGWMPECDELESLQYRARATCLSPQEREELCREAEGWIERRESPTTTEASLVSAGAARRR